MPTKSGTSVSAQAVLGALQESSRLIRWGFLLLALLYLFSGVTRVAPHENAVILRFGKLQPKLHPPGLLFAWPLPVDEVIRVPVRSALELRLDAWGSPEGNGSETLHPFRTGYTLTGDANVVHARLTARFRIVDPIAYAFSAQDPELLLEALLYQSLTRSLASTGVDAALTTERELLRQDAQRLAQAELDRLELGIQIVALEFRELLPEVSVIPAFQEVVSAQVESRTISQQAQSYRAEVIPAAEAEAYRMRQEAQAAAADQIARAQGEAHSFRSLRREYQRNPELTRTRMRAETWEQISGQIKGSTLLPNAAEHMWVPTQPEKVE